MITGGIKFFEQAKNLFKDGATILATSNTEAAKYVLDLNRYTQWVSVASNDLTTEELTITLNGNKTIDRLFLLDINFKEFEVKYWNGSAWASFTNVIGPNGVSYANAGSTSYALSSAYFEFDQVTTGQLKISCLKTQTANAQKYLTTFLATKELGTFQGLPRIEPKVMRNEEKVKSLGGKYLVQKGYETYQIKISLKSHPYQVDLDLVDTLFNSEESFLVYPCGGRYGSTYFRLDQKGFGIDDVFNMQLVGALDSKYEKGVYTLGASKNITLEEHI